MLGLSAEAGVVERGWTCTLITEKENHVILTKLPNGAWLDLTLVNSIRPHDVPPYTWASKCSPRVEIGVGTAAAFTTLEFENFQSAVDWEAVLGNLVNLSLKELRNDSQAKSDNKLSTGGSFKSF